MRDLASRGLVMRTKPGADLYVIWSTVAYGPMWIGNEAELAELLGTECADRLARARDTGTSSRFGEGGWDDTGFVAEQVGWLPRDRMHEYALAYREGGIDVAKQHLEPFEDDEPVTT